MSKYTVTMDLTDEQDLMLEKITKARDNYRKRTGDYDGEPSAKADVLEMLMQSKWTDFIQDRLRFGMNICSDYMEEKGCR